MFYVEYHSRLNNEESEIGGKYKLEKVKFYLKESIGLNSAVISCICEDLDEDGQKEVIVGTYDNLLRVFKFDKENFSQIAVIRNPSPITSIGCGALGQNSNKEIFVAGRDKYLRAYKLNQSGLVETGKHRFYDIIYDISIGDVFSNNLNELVISSGKFISIFSYYQGELREEGVIRQEQYVFQIKIADIDNDGKNDIIYGGRDNHIHIIQYESRFFQSVKASLKLGYYILKFETFFNIASGTSDIFIATADGKFQGYRYIQGVFQPLFSVNFQKNVNSFIISRLNDSEIHWILCAIGSEFKLFRFKEDILELMTNGALSSSINSINTIKLKETTVINFLIGSEKGDLMFYEVK